MANYIVFDKLDSRFVTKPFETGKLLLKELYISNHSIKFKKIDPGFELHGLNPKLFSQHLASVLAIAGRDGETIITLEDSSFLSLNFAKDFILGNEKIKTETEKLLNALELTTDFLADVYHINKIICRKPTLDYIKKNIKHSFEGFKASIYVGADIDADIYLNENMDTLFDILKLQRVYSNLQLIPSGYDILLHAPDVAEKLAGKILLDAFDSGIDFLVVNDVRTFALFETHRNRIEKAVARKIPLVILTLSQILLMALGITDKKALGFHKHTLTPRLLG